MKRHRRLAEILSDNALLAIKRAQSDAHEHGEKFTVSMLADRMVSMMERPADFEGKTEEEWRDGKKATVLRTLAYLGVKIRDELPATVAPERTWDADFIELFCNALGVKPELLASPDYRERFKR